MLEDDKERVQAKPVGIGRWMKHLVLMVEKAAATGAGERPRGRDAIAVRSNGVGSRMSSRRRHPRDPFPATAADDAWKHHRGSPRPCRGSRRGSCMIVTGRRGIREMKRAEMQSARGPQLAASEAAERSGDLRCKKGAGPYLEHKGRELLS